MNRAAVRVPDKWRPRLSHIVAAMLATVLALPLVSMFFFRIYDNQLIRETEVELIAQSAALVAVIQREAASMPPGDLPLGAEAPPLPPGDEAEPYRPILPRLDLVADDLEGSRPLARLATAPAATGYLALGARVMPDLLATQRMTLAGFRLLDPNGVVVAGRDEVGMSLAGIPEVAEALAGRFRSAMRLRVPQEPPPPVYSVSRGTSVRIFTAMPILVRGHVAGVLYASRTPANVFQRLYAERHKVVAAVGSVLVLTLMIGVAFHLTISAPIRALLARTAAIASGDREAIRPLRHHGTAELARLTQGFLDMAASLAARSDFVVTLAAHMTHELKSPLTAIQGAAELLEEDIGSAHPMTDDERRRFLGNIVSNARRMTAIVNRLRELARADTMPSVGMTSLAEVLPGLSSAFPALAIDASGDLGIPMPMTSENLGIVLGHLADNAQRHGAARLEVTAKAGPGGMMLVVADDGAGISPNNRARVFDSFFTTRRNEGGTGMGLSIVRAMLASHGGAIALADSAQGARFRLSIPLR
jgi:signal transduction histidine kinase